MEGGAVAEKPRSFNPLCSFGLEEPLIWICRRIDAIQTSELQAILEKLSTPSARAWFPNPISAWSLIGRAKKILGRVPQRDALSSVIRKLKKSACWLFAKRILSIITLLLVVEGAYDHTLYSTNMHVVQDPRSDIEDVSSAMGWLENYVEAPWGRHTLGRFAFLSKDKAEQKIATVKHQWEQKHWDRVREETRLKEQAVMARKYIESFPNGAHVDDVQRIVERNEFTVSYRTLMGRCEFLEAGHMLGDKLLPGQMERNPEWVQGMAKGFWGKTGACMQHNITALIEKNRFNEARQILSKADQLPPILFSIQGKKSLKAMKRKVDFGYDSYLYQQVQNVGTKDVARTYLNTAPEKCMNKEVQAFTDFIDSREKELKLKLLLQNIQWGNVSDFDDIKLEVGVSGKVILVRTQIKSSAGQLSTIDASSGNFFRYLDDSVAVSIRAENDGLFRDKIVFDELKMVKMKNVCRKNGLGSLSIATGKGTLKFKVYGCPKAHDLPKWHGC